MTPRKKLIEVALPLEAINAASAREKSIRHGHPSTLHLWWARRPLAAARAVIFAQMVDDPSAHPERFPTEEAQERERQRLFRLIEELVKWENTTNETVLMQAREEIWRSWRMTCAENRDHSRAAELFDPDKLPAFHDPFAGGGALPLEAQRLGLESYASDLNPVAVLINKAMIEIPPKFAGRPPVNPEARRGTAYTGSWKGAAGLAEDVRYYGKWMRDEAEKRIGHLYPKIEITAEMAKERPDLKNYVGRKLTVIAWLWARTVKSPNPAFAHVDVPLASTFMLSTKTGKEAYVEPVLTSPPKPLSLTGEGEAMNGGYRFVVKVGKSKNAEAAKAGTKLARGANFRCVMSETPITGDYIKAEGRAGRMGARLMAVVAEGERGRVYLSPTPEHEAIARQAEPEWRPEGDVPARLTGGTCVPYGLASWGDLFTPRQLVALTTFSDLVQEAREKVKTDYLTPSFSPSPVKERGLGGEVIKHHGITQSAHVSAEKLNLARQIRKLPTTAEAQAWELLRNRRCHGFKFRRQQVIRGLIVDFYCPELRLALELDGEIHQQQREYDAARDALLAAEGITVLRVPNAEVGKIVERVGAMKTSPPGLLSLTGEGEVDHELGLEAGGTGATAYAEAVGVYLAFALSKVANIGSSIASWMSDRGAFRETFARQAIPMVWDYAEANPFVDAGGSLGAALGKGAMVVAAFPATKIGRVAQSDAATQMTTLNKLVSTDPPYYDNIGYADLSDFFYVWLRRSLRPVFPNLFATLAVPKAEELVATPYRHGSRDKAEAFFLDGMTRAMHRLAEHALPTFPVTIYYAFKQSESDNDAGTANTGWETFLDAVIRAGFALTGTWPMRTEGAGRILAKDTNALASSIVLVCRKRPPDAPITTRRDFLKALHSELPAALKKLQHGNIAPVDLAQSAIGPGMAIFTRHAKVLESDDRPMTVRTALQLINQALDEYLSEQEGEYDADTRFAITWFETHGMDEGPYGVAETLATARGVAVNGVQEAGILIAKGGKVRLLKREELPENWNPAADSRLTVWEATQQLIRTMETKGEATAGTLITQLGSIGETTRDLAYRLYGICERKKWADEALAYNALVIAWPELTRLAAQGSVSRPVSGDLEF